MSVIVMRDAGHPWSAAPGWDQLHLVVTNAEQFEAMIKDAESKFWQVWVRDTSQHAAVLYKPAGASATWCDDPRLGTSHVRCLSIAVGDEVYTDFTGRISKHRVVERQTRETSGHVSQTDAQLRVTPPVKGSGYVAEPGDKIRQKSLAWMDAAWFRPVE